MSSFGGFWSRKSPQSPRDTSEPSKPPGPTPPPNKDTVPEEPTTSHQQDGSDAQAEQPQNTQDGGFSDGKLDIVFLQDTTASQSPYIEAAKTAIEKICQQLSTKTNMAPQNIRFGLVAFRDHPPQDRTYVTLEFPFSSDIAAMQRNLKSLRAQGGGDGPEAVTAAMAAGLNMPWDEKAAKMIVLITDAPPHGIGEANDGFDASPDQNDPLELARQMAEQGITLHMVACEPTLSKSYKNAVDFYAALTDITGGKMLPLTMAHALGDYIAGTAVETIETEKLINEYKDKIVDNVYGQSKPLEEVVQQMQQTLESRNVQMHTLDTGAAYIPSPAAMANQMAWQKAGNISGARRKVTSVEGARYTGAPAPAAAPYMADFARSRAPSTEARRSYSAMPPPPAAPGFGGPPPMSYAPPAATSMSSATINLAQTRKVVMQSVMRSSKVTENGMAQKETS